MEKTKMHPFCEILYKTDDSPGWLYGIMAGDKKTVEKKCKKNFFAYQIFDGNKTVEEVKDIYPCKPRSDMVHLTTDWIYNEELDRWFLPEETSTCPSSPCTDAKKIKFGFDLSGGKWFNSNTLSDLLEYYTEEKDICCNDTVYITASITVKIDRKKIWISINYSGYVYDDFCEFIEGIKADRYSYLIIEEYSFIKILSWPQGEKCRIKIQSYEKFIDLIYDMADFSIDKEVFISSISKFIEYLNNTYKRIDQEVRAAYKLQKRNYNKEWTNE